MNIRLIGLDLDGTVFDSHKRITPRTRAAIAAACAQGVAVLPVTGRPRAGLPAEFLSIPGVKYAITSNGAVVCEAATGRVLSQSPMALEHALWGLEMAEELGALTDVYVDGRAYTKAATFHSLLQAAPENMKEYFRVTRVPVEDQRLWLMQQKGPVEKLTMLFTSESQRQKAWTLFRDSGRFEATSSLQNNLELNGKGVDKGKALLALAALLGFSQSQVMACGDSTNDLAMLQAAALSVAMGNACPQVLKAARVRTATNDQDGVALAIEQYVLNGKGAD